MNTEDLGLCVAVSAGQMPYKELCELKEAGAFRYLVRIETSNPELFARIHPEDQTFESRVKCLQDIKAAGLQLGTGAWLRASAPLEGRKPEERGLGAEEAVGEESCSRRG